ncbi:sigma-54-dependent transcriptional regulator [Pseudazoarcus pumilus]|uniref:Sigma-54-dependent Fis family transcriptional regulator n=1 Tax=Pseudazoarcus pumilus TaxID=2067960 RepID=A0A2I6S7H6_9RHOO|nr:sigma-54 dependent transcriptional regulator [Pseudazoarcus pumilus]AUN95198.1 sigma-54-dependent Fis family transcriptional regulator [Pseudazoarcus pumilus]
MKTLILIEDDPIMGESLQQRFEIEGFEVLWCRRLAEADEALQRTPAAVVSDVRLPDGIATDWFVRLPATIRAIPWVFLTGYGSVDDAVASMRAGAREYLTKPFDVERLVALVHTLACSADPAEDDAVLGVSPAMRRIEAMLRKVATQRAAVLLSGESGVGKEVAAQYLHALDARTDKGEFVAVNCAAIPETLLEAEFFGYEKGAFSGAQRSHRGYLERAHRGTLFLDEVAELPASMQAKLLRALQEKCFFRLGAERATHSDFRILAATNRDLYTEMNAGRFREDLFYRLAVLRIPIPPLRERPEDIRWLAERMLARLVAEQGRPLAMSETFLRDLMARDWRGNARELQSWLEQAVVLSDNGLLDAPPTDAAPAATPSDGIKPLQHVVEGAERVHIRRALQHCEGSVGKTAEALGISRKTLWEKMKKHAITSPG